jgi:hypothetical protein
MGCNDSERDCPADTPIASCVPRCGDLLCERIAWEAKHPRPWQLIAAERAIVRGLKDAGLGTQHQVTHQDRFEIAVGDLLIRVEHSPVESLPGGQDA